MEPMRAFEATDESKQSPIAPREAAGYHRCPFPGNPPLRKGCSGWSTMLKRRASLVIWGVLALGILGAAALIVQRLGNEREARRRNNLAIALVEADPRGGRVPAIAELETALRLRPAYRTARYNLGLTRFRTNDLGGARQELETVLRDDPDHVRARYVLGLLSESAGAWDEAIEHLRAVLRQDPMDHHAWLHLGRCLVQLGKEAEAADAFRKAVGIAPWNREARYALRGVLVKLGKEAEMKGELAKFLELEKQRKLGTLPESEAAERNALPIPDSEAPREPADPPARYVEITHDVGLEFHHAGVRDAEIEKALSSTWMPRAWFERNQARFIAAASASCAFLDIDNDDRLDLLLLNVDLLNADGHHRLLRQVAGGKLVDATAAAGVGGKPAIGTAVACGDYDNDGWTDIFIAGLGGARLYHNAAGKLEDVTDSSGIAAAVPLDSWCSGAAFADVDHDADLDIYVTRLADLARPASYADLRFPDDFEGQSNLLFRNNRDGTFTEIGREAHAASGAGKARSVLFTDSNGDGAIDCVTFDWHGAASVHLNQRDGTFGPPASASSPPISLFPVGVAHAYGDHDRDGAPDLLVVRSGAAAALFRNQTVPRNWLTARLEGRTAAGVDKSNRRGIGGKVEVRSARRWRAKELRAGNGLGGCDAPELYFDLADEGAVDYARAFFPSGARRAEKEVQSNRTITLQEPDLSNNSCPTVFTWNGSGFEFITDTISAGILGEVVAPGQYWKPDPDEWIRIEGERLKSAGGRLEVRWVNPLEEVTYLDQVRLVAVEHPDGIEVYPGERMAGDAASRAPAKLHLLERLRPLEGATGGDGDDVRGVLAHADRKYFDRFRLLPFGGFAEDWTLTLDLGPSPGKALLLHGWTHWNSSASAIAASQAKKSLWGPVLEVQAGDGTWRTGLADLGVPAGLPRTMLVDLDGVLKDGERVVRIRTNRTVYFDQALVSDPVATLDLAAPSPIPRVRAVELPLSRADLQRLGYPRRTLPDGKQPEVPDYSRIDAGAEWGGHRGFLTRFGDVAELLASVDDRFVVMGHGEEVALSFDAAELGQVPAGSRRTFLLYSNGFEKGRDIHGAHPFTVEPLPFQAMGSYPYPVEAAPADEGRARYELEWNTRRSGGD
jgi:tetratricopeptide (TPR) repeat protein